ncbi:hypothetical protein CONLIGDRAFT_684972 [Coniochaeta ligniaria NRRL 30616]|uniref:Uncharacterized protein n=1 Tax=Coniochaeta ligniaria NRRL 30616 TaxID=1408157 RepID=A0A1J7JBZ3_9PEZI|nr:hypothetical protein CONLIGDRAFT_684972 [Coniochaeta ligniaria NRRL 30616]
MTADWLPFREVPKDTDWESKFGDKWPEVQQLFTTFNYKLLRRSPIVMLHALLGASRLDREGRRAAIQRAKDEEMQARGAGTARVAPAGQKRVFEDTLSSEDIYNASPPANKRPRLSEADVSLNDNLQPLFRCLRALSSPAPNSRLLFLLSTTTYPNARLRPPAPARANPPAVPHGTHRYCTDVGHEFTHTVPAEFTTFNTYRVRVLYLKRRLGEVDCVVRDKPAVWTVVNALRDYDSEWYRVLVGKMAGGDLVVSGGAWDVPQKATETEIASSSTTPSLKRYVDEMYDVDHH